MIRRDNGSKSNYSEFYGKFWKLQEILCNRDYVTKEVSRWDELHQLIRYVTKRMSEIKELTRAGELEKESLDLDKIYLNFQPQEFDGKRGKASDNEQIRTRFFPCIRPERMCF